MRLLPELPGGPMPAWQRWLCFIIALVTSVLWVPAVIVTLIVGWAFGLFDEPEEK